MAALICVASAGLAAGDADPTFPDRDPLVRPGESFDRYANGRWLARPFRPDRSTEAVFVDVQERIDEQLRAILEEQQSSEPDTERLQAFYTSFLDEERVESVGDAPLLADLAELQRIADHAELAVWLARTPGRFGADLFDLSVDSDLRAPAKHAAYLSQGRLGLPDRAYYLEDRHAGTRDAYTKHVRDALSLAGWADPDIAQAVVQFETKLATSQWTRAASRENARIYNPRSLAELETAAPQFPWRAWAASAGAPDRLILVQDTAILEAARAFAVTPLETVKAWAAFRLASDAAPYSRRAHAQLRFAFYGRELAGQSQEAPRWKRGVGLVDTLLGEALGRTYVSRHFPPEARTQALAMVGEVRAALRARLEAAEWITDKTRMEALAKIDALNVKVGYPTSWRSYAGLVIRSGDLFGNVKRVRAFERRYQLERLSRPVDRQRWSVTPQFLSAYYDPTLNEIVIPAGRLQPPFFAAGGDAAVNYGGIGSVIGHEISHGFDDQGRGFDGQGRLRDWWDPKDAEAFKARATVLADQYSAIELLPGLKMNGSQVLGEALADVVGLQAAYDAWQRSTAAKKAPVIDGLTGDQRFFLSYARTRRDRFTDEVLRRRAATAVHPPGRNRIEQTLRNLEPWYRAFDVKPSDPAWVPPERRVRIW